MCSPLSKFRYSTIVQADQKNKETPDFKGFLKKKIERVMGIEPTYPAWKAGVLPLNYTRISVGVTGFEPATSWSQTRRSSQAEPHPESIVFHYTFKTSYKVQESNVFESRSSRFRFASSRWFCYAKLRLYQVPYPQTSLLHATSYILPSFSALVKPSID